MSSEKPKESSKSKLVINGFKRNTQQTSQSRQERSPTIQPTQTSSTNHFWTDDRVQQWKEIRQKTSDYTFALNTAIKSNGVQEKAWRFLKIILLTFTFPIWAPVMLVLFIIYMIFGGGKGGSINCGPNGSSNNSGPNGGGGGVNMQ